MRIELVTPSTTATHSGNTVTAQRWAGLLGDLGHDVRCAEAWSGEDVDVLVALHARKSAAAAEKFSAAHPDRRLVVALTGTDLYRDLPHSTEAQAAVALADALIVLQERARERVPPHAAGKVWVLHQSVPTPARMLPPRSDAFEVAFLSHVRAVKDPLLPATAAELLPASSAIEIVHCGAPLDEALAEQARAFDRRSRRYRWLGDQPRDDALALLGRARLLLLTSRSEGGANVVSEALAAGTPVLATRIDGSVGLLGDDYPGYVPVGDAGALAAALHRAETDDAFLADLRAACHERASLVDPARERATWAELLDSLA